MKLRDAGTLLLLGIALVISAGASLVFGTAAGWVTDFLRLDDVVAGPLTTSIKIAVPLVLSWVTALIMFRLAAGLKLSRRALLEGTILAALGTTVLQVFSTELLAGAGRNPILAPFAIIIGLLIWFNLVSQVYLVSAGGPLSGRRTWRNSPQGTRRAPGERGRSSRARYLSTRSMLPRLLPGVEVLPGQGSADPGSPCRLNPTVRPPALPRPRSNRTGSRGHGGPVRCPTRRP
jgi:hypothetical protein